VTRRERETSAEEQELFRASLKDAHLFKRQSAGATKKAAKSGTIAKDDAPSKRPQPIARPAGLDGRTSERLRRGQLEPQSRLDLHGLTETRAHGALARFIVSAHARGERLVLVVTGKGLKPAAPDAPFDMKLEARARGILKTLTPRWLKEPALAPLIADVRAAHRKHGGDGALYIYLRKS
jgi:DNA-nicking Smr family endonuclease